jgi:hypothetical protein
MINRSEMNINTHTHNLSPGVVYTINLCSSLNPVIKKEKNKLNTCSNALWIGTANVWVHSIVGERSRVIDYESYQRFIISFHV